MDKKIYYDAEDGESFILEPQCNIRCCDCGLVHNYEIKLLVTMRRDNRRTAQSRRQMKLKGELK